MKKVVILLMMTGVFTLGHLQSMAQSDTEAEIQSDSTELVDAADSTEAVEPVEEYVEEEVAVVEDYAEEEPGFHQIVKEQFIAGGWEFMGIVLLCLILGLAVAIERIITLNLATTNVKKLLSQVEGALSSGGVEAAKDVCRNDENV